jgi:hypothetical protein
VTLGPVITSNKERGLGIFRVEEIQDVIGVSERTIIECKSNHTRGRASLDDASYRDFVSIAMV